MSLLLLVPVIGAAALAPDAPEACPYVPGLGLACAVPGGYELPRPDGSRLFTHGLDPVLPDEPDVAGAYAPLRDPVCVDDPLTQYHGHLIYAHPADKPNRGAELASALRDLVREANGLLYREGAEFGAPVEYRFSCDGGQVALSIVTIPVATGAGDYTTLTSALEGMGFTNGHAKYWVWYDDPSACACGGIAAAPLDPQRSPHNRANGGGYFGVTYGHFSARIPMHENGHNLGAVADSAPDSSGAGHCNDGQDIMCYADGGPTSQYKGNVCSDRTHFDCGHDSYFHPDPAAGSYLALRWQLGAPIVRYVDGCLYEDGAVALPMSSVEVALPPACAGHRYAIYGREAAAQTQHLAGQLPVALALNVFEVCWYANETLLDCPANTKPWGHEGRVPAGATRAVVTWAQGVDGRFTLSVI